MRVALVYALWASTVFGINVVLDWKYEEEYLDYYYPDGGALVTPGLQNADEFYLSDSKDCLLWTRESGPMFACIDPETGKHKFGFNSNHTQWFSYDDKTTTVMASVAQSPFKSTVGGYDMKNFQGPAWKIPKPSWTVTGPRNNSGDFCDFQFGHPNKLEFCRGTHHLQLTQSSSVLALFASEVRIIHHTTGKVTSRWSLPTDGTSLTVGGMVVDEQESVVYMVVTPYLYKLQLSSGKILKKKNIINAGETTINLALPGAVCMQWWSDPGEGEEDYFVGCLSRDSLDTLWKLDSKQILDLVLPNHNNSVTPYYPQEFAKMSIWTVGSSVYRMALQVNLMSNNNRMDYVITLDGKSGKLKSTTEVYKLIKTNYPSSQMRRICDFSFKTTKGVVTQGDVWGCFTQNNPGLGTYLFLFDALSGEQVGNWNLTDIYGHAYGYSCFYPSQCIGVYAGPWLLIDKPYIYTWAAYHDIGLWNSFWRLKIED